MRAILLAIILLCVAPFGLADEITIKGEIYRDVYVVKGQSEYVVLLPETGGEIRASIQRKDVSGVKLSSDVERLELRAKWQAKRDSLKVKHSEKAEMLDLERERTEAARAEALAQQQVEQEKAWRIDVASWKSLSDAERATARKIVQQKERELRVRWARVAELSDMIASANVVIGDASRELDEVAAQYERKRQRSGADMDLEMQFRQAAREEWAAITTVEEWIVLYNQELGLFQSEYAWFEYEQQRILALDSAIGVEPAEVWSPLEEEPSGTATGTGFVVADDLVMTCAHVVEGAKSMTVRYQGGETSAVSVVRKNDDSDWCVLRVEGIKAQGIPVAPSDGKLGSAVYCIGYPLDSIKQSTEPTVGSGNIAAVKGLGDDDRHIQVTIPINSGNSGSPVIDSYGRWVGLVSHKANDVAILSVAGEVPQGWNFAVKASHIRKALPSNVSENLISTTSMQQLSLEQIADKYRSAIVLITSTR